MKLVPFIVLSIGYLSSWVESAEQYAPIVQLKNGQVRGKVEEIFDTGKKVNYYEAIRYGRAERFEKPKPAEPWTDVYNATEMTYACPMTTEPKKQSEDCLFLSVWLPEHKKENRSVMVWIHGGGYMTGSIFDRWFDSRYLASGGDVVVVNVAYRLGALGFMATDKLANFGLYDPILALQWVRDNIGAFGGNENDVTIFGESAGAFSIAALVQSPLANGLFHRAIMQSGSSLGIASLQAGQNNTEHLAARLHCITTPLSAAVKCLKSVPIKDLLANGGGGGFWPVYGDKVLPLAPIKALKSGQFNRVDMIYGVCNNEGSGFVSRMFEHGHENMTLESTKHDLAAALKNRDSKLVVDKIVKFYMSQLGANPTQDQMKTLIADSVGDSSLVCPTILFAEEMAKIEPNRKYFSYRLMQNGEDHLTWKGVTHGTDLSFLFDVPSVRGKPAAFQLSNDVISAWANFAKTGQPGMMGTVRWESAFNSTKLATRYMSLDSTNYRLIDNYYVERCDTLWKAKIIA